MIRWVLTDPFSRETYSLRRNPKTMTGGVNAQRTTTFGNQFGVRAMRKGVLPQAFDFAGLIVTQQEYDALLAWAGRSLVWVGDHRGQTHEVVPLGFEAVPRRTGRYGDARYEYTFKSLYLRKVVSL